METIASLGFALLRMFKINQATLSGALDIIAIRDEKGRIDATPFFVRFGKIKAPTAHDKEVRIRVNGIDIEGVSMKLNDQGIAFFTPMEDFTLHSNVGELITASNSKQEDFFD